MKKVTLINVRISNTVFMPLGLLYLAALLEKDGFKVQVVDPFTYENETDIIQSVVRFDPGYIGFSIVTPAYEKTKSFRNKLNKYFNGKKFFAGGVHASVLPENTLVDLNLDFIVRGEGEDSLLEVLNCVEDNSSMDNVKGITFRDSHGQIRHNPDREFISNIDLFPFPARNLINVEKYFIPPGYIRSYFLDRVANIITSRGCPMHCTFCCSHLLFGRKVRKRSIGNILQEVDLLIDQYKINGIYFSDETFTTDHNWVLGFCKEIKKRKLPWGCATRIDFIDNTLIRAMKDSGCKQIELGVESGSNNVLKTIKKNTSSDKIKKTFLFLRQNKIRAFANLMVGSPLETEKDILKTKKLLQEIKPDYSLISWFTPFPGTEAYDWMVANKGRKLSISEYNYDFITSDKPLVNLTNMDMTQLINARALLQRATFFNNYLSMVNLHNLRYLIDALFYSLFSPIRLLRASYLSIRRSTFEHFVYFIFYNYQEVMIKKAKRYLIKEV